MKRLLGRLSKPSAMDGTIIVACLVVVFVLLQTPIFSHAQSPVKAWDGDFVAYKVGDIVSYDNNTYKCLQAHTSEPNWNPHDVPALWDLQSSWSLDSIIPPNNDTPTPTPTPFVDTPTPTPTPFVDTPTPTPSPVADMPTPTPSPVVDMPTPTPSPVSNPGNGNTPAGKNAGYGPATLGDDAFAKSSLDLATVSCLQKTHPEVTGDQLQPICATFYNDLGLMADGRSTHTGACSVWATQYPFGTTFDLYTTANPSPGDQPAYRCTSEDVFGGFVGTSTDEKMGFCQNHIDVWDQDVNADIQRGVQPMYLKVTGMNQDVAQAAKSNSPSSPGCGLTWS